MTEPTAGEALPFLPPRPAQLNEIEAIYNLDSNSPADIIIQGILSNLTHWYYDFDLEACLAILAFLGSYRLNLAVPLWLHVIGDPASGKTEALMNLLVDVSPDHHVQGELSTNTFLSGLTKGRGNGHMNSLLNRIGPRGMLIFPDFTTFLESDPATVGIVAGQFRSIFDGHYKKEVGVEKKIEWRGNLSVVTALTPGREPAWNEHNSGGERFVTVRWRQPEDKEQLALMAIGNSLNQEEKLGRYEESRLAVRMLVNGVIGQGLGELTLPRSPVVKELEEFGIPALAGLVTMTRNMPARADGHQASHALSDESPARIGQQLVNTARGLAAMRRKDEIGREELRIVRRLALDTIPPERKWVIDAFVKSKEMELQAAEIKPFTEYRSDTGLARTLQDMYAINILQRYGRVYRLSERFRRLMVRAGLLDS